MPSFVPTNLVCLAHACSPSTCRAVSSQQPTSLHTLLLLQIQTWPQALHDPPPHAVFRGRGSLSPSQT